MGRPAGLKQAPKMSHVGSLVYPGFDWEVRPRGKVVIVTEPMRTCVPKRKQWRDRKTTITVAMFLQMKKMLLQTNFPVKYITFQVGTNPNSACRYFLRKTGLTMTQWRRKMKAKK